MIKSLAVYCGANPGHNPEFIKLAQRFGQELADHQISLVYGGGQYGMMGAVANSVLDHGGQVHGVITRELYDRGTSLDRLSDLQIVPNMDIRKDKMMNLADGLIALPGGLGTLKEVSEAFSWTAIGDNAKPVALFNFNGYYNPLKSMLGKMQVAGFAERDFVESIGFIATFNELLDFMDNYQAPAVRTYR